MVFKEDVTALPISLKTLSCCSLCAVSLKHTSLFEFSGDLGLGRLIDKIYIITYEKARNLPLRRFTARTFFSCDLRRQRKAAQGEFFVSREKEGGYGAGFDIYRIHFFERSYLRYGVGDKSLVAGLEVFYA